MSLYRLAHTQSKTSDCKRALGRDLQNLNTADRSPEFFSLTHLINTRMSSHVGVYQLGLCTAERMVGSVCSILVSDGRGKNATRARSMADSQGLDELNLIRIVEISPQLASFLYAKATSSLMSGLWPGCTGRPPCKC